VHAFHVDCFFPLSLPRLLLDLTVYMSKTAGVLYEAGTTYLLLFLWGLMSYLRYMWVCSDFQHILCGIFALSVFVFCVYVAGLSELSIFLLPLRYSLTFIHIILQDICIQTREEFLF